MDEITTAYAWQESLELSKRLVRVCEEFSDADTNVLVWHLRSSVVDIPATVAADLQAGRAASMEPAVRLATALALVRKIYPAIETAEAEEQLERLVARMQSERFGERPTPPEAEATGEAEAGPISAEAGDTALVAEAADDDEGDDPGASTAITPPQVDGVHQVISLHPDSDQYRSGGAN